MRPSLEANDVVNLSIPDSELSGEGSLGRAISVTRTNRPHGVFGQSCAVILRSAMNWRRLQSTLLHAIARVVERRAEKEVVWIYAATVVTAVQNVKAVWNWTAKELPSHAMRSLWTVVATEVAVTAWVERANPLPAVIPAAASNLAPKALFCCGHVINFTS